MHCIECVRVYAWSTVDRDSAEHVSTAKDMEHADRAEGMEHADSTECFDSPLGISVQSKCEDIRVKCREIST